LDSTAYYAVIEVPAGTTRLQKIDTAGQVVAETEPPVDFLPFPGNYGFISGSGIVDTASRELRPLPVLVMMHALETGSIVEIHPVATLLLTVSDRPHPVVIAIPADTSLQSIKAGSYIDFITEYEAARHILQQWFLNYHGRAMFGLTGWRDENYAKQLIADWKQKQ
jgi:inorganic pyrophosphatase